MNTKRTQGDVKHNLKKTCLYSKCAKRFKSHRRNRKFCSDFCKGKDWREKNPREFISVEKLRQLRIDSSSSLTDLQIKIDDIIEDLRFKQ